MCQTIENPLKQKCLSLLTLASGALANASDHFVSAVINREKRALGERNVVGKYCTTVARLLWLRQIKLAFFEAFQPF